MAVTTRSLRVLFGACLMTLTGGCPVSDFLGVKVEIINDTGFAVAPNIRFDDDTNVLARVFPADDLTTGLLEPGESVSFVFDCDELGLIFSDDAEQVLLFFDDAVADDSDVLKRDDDFDCGDVIRFIFVGEDVDFGVVVTVNGRVVD